MTQYLIETALLGHGLASISNKEIADRWPIAQAQLVWLSGGKIIIGQLDDFLPLRSRAEQLCRLDAAALPAAIEQKATGVLTASATMAVCQDKNIPLAVTCGMGGIGPLPTSQVGADLVALRQWPVILIASAPKDVFDLSATLQWLHEHNVTILGANQNICNGFLTYNKIYQLDGGLAQFPNHLCHLLILNGLAQRPVSANMLTDAMHAGELAQQQGAAYHPAVNKYLDTVTGGISSQEQLSGLIANISLAEQLAARYNLK